MTSVNITMPAVNPVAAGALAAVPGATANARASDSPISFDDILDIVNPLQHFPVVSTLYRAITGDQIKTFPKIAGDALYGGWMGFAGSIADTIFEKVTGKSFRGTPLAMAGDMLSPSHSEPSTG